MAMTQAGFNQTINELIAVFGEKKYAPGRAKALWECISDLDDNWFQVFAKRMISEFNENLNIVEAARGERMARRDIDKTIRIALAAPVQSGHALEDILEKAGKKSLTDLIFNKPSNQAGEQEQK